MAEEFELYNVEKIKDRRYSPKKQKTFYLVKWENYPDEDNSWEPEENLESVAHLLLHFNTKWDKREQKRAKAKKDKLDRMAAAKKQRDNLKAEAALQAHKASADAYSKLETADMAEDIPMTRVPVVASDDPEKVSEDPEEPEEPVQEEVSAPPQEEPVPMELEPPRKINFTHMLLQPSLSFDQPAKILGCHKKADELIYSVLFRRRADGLVPCAALVPHKELASVAPGLLSQYLLSHISL